MNKFTERAQDYFERHPLSAECHITSDERVFHTLGSAQSFAGTLDDQKVESYLRKVLEKEVAIKTEDKDDTKPNDAEILAKTVFLQNSDLEKLDYNDLKSLAKFFDVEAENQKGPTLIAALNEFKSTLNK